MILNRAPVVAALCPVRGGRRALCRRRVGGGAEGGPPGLGEPRRCREAPSEPTTDVGRLQERAEGEWLVEEIWL